MGNEFGIIDGVYVGGGYFVEVLYCVCYVIWYWRLWVVVVVEKCFFFVVDKYIVCFCVLDCV